MFSNRSDGHILTENMSYLADSVPAHTDSTAQLLLAELWTPANCPPYSPNLNLLNFPIWRVLQVEVQATPHANLDALHPFPRNRTGKMQN